ncbi:uncharacterized protein SPPG_08387 [Spizellomyces punctatus DAOM BR117]|uniref:Uncharacterized protein n=1 Tax=Spizellomyces punctatus (strain DAOM BR117) TaxID=645134 RepID=A0A0L0H692_SPIPD|nr:uncharacterized protein SPPG_08387 [Spizellomyces punctatus DAOM BR117]KNC96233.1 hypothetical protein SPPG_08387 [Spizellomyces punctatus DAOM BR117]|eukprot:XP_016604273.1 hypothetical protein SPPG_08387 [Spizellomyces punctatus DAOM BR117]
MTLGSTSTPFGRPSDLSCDDAQSNSLFQGLRQTPYHSWREPTTVFIPEPKCLFISNDCKICYDVQWKFDLTTSGRLKSACSAPGVRCIDYGTWNETHWMARVWPAGKRIRCGIQQEKNVLCLLEEESLVVQRRNDVMMRDVQGADSSRQKNESIAEAMKITVYVVISVFLLLCGCLLLHRRCCLRRNRNRFIIDEETSNDDLDTPPATIQLQPPSTPFDPIPGTLPPPPPAYTENLVLPPLAPPAYEPKPESEDTEGEELATVVEGEDDDLGTPTSSVCIPLGETIEIQPAEEANDSETPSQMGSARQAQSRDIEPPHQERDHRNLASIPPQLQPTEHESEHLDIPSPSDTISSTPRSPNDRETLHSGHETAPESPASP